MKIRVKFSKNGPVKFLGHLDTMRYFQKALRRGEIPIAFSSGFRPHMIISFAAPLSVGVTSDCEYFDMELSGEMEPSEILQRFNESMVEGFRVLHAGKVPEGKKYNAMSLTAAVDYKVTLKRPQDKEAIAGQTEAFYAQPSIQIEKAAKKGTKTVDIKPGIYKMSGKNGIISMRLDASSSNYLKPQIVMEAFALFCGIDPAQMKYTLHREEVYANEGTKETPCFVPLYKLEHVSEFPGENIE